MVSDDDLKLFVELSEPDSVTGRLARELTAEKQRSERLVKALRELVWCLGPDNPNDYRPTQIFSRTDRAILDARAALGDSNV